MAQQSQRRSRQTSRPSRQSKNFEQKISLPDVSKQALKLIPLGGVEELGKNMWALEQDNEIIVLDMGLELPDIDQPGVDYIIPNTQYLVQNRDKIKGVILTSPHPDHIGAVPYLLHMLPNLNVYATPELFTIMESRYDVYSQNIRYRKHVIKPYSSHRIGSFKIVFFPTESNTVGTIGLCLFTMQGKIIYLSSYKLNQSSDNEQNDWLEYIKELAGSDTVAFLGTSIGSEAEGFAPTEDSIQDYLETIISRKTGTVYISTFPSMLRRLQQIVTVTEKQGKHIFIDGKSILNTFNTARKKGFLQVKQGTIVGPAMLKDIPAESLVIIIAGASGEDSPQLMKLANRQHPMFSVNPGDTVIYPSALIPGNARSVQKVNDNFAKMGAFVELYQPLDTVHSGYARQQDILKMLKVIRPKYYIPINGPHYSLRMNANIALDGGYPEQNLIIPLKGRVILFDYKQRRKTPEKVLVTPVFVDGLGVGDLTDVVIRDRQSMSEDGIMHIVVLLDEQTRSIIRSPEIVTKGFVDIEGSSNLLQEIKEATHILIEGLISNSDEFDTAFVRDELREQIGKMIMMKTERRPMILPIVILV